MKRATLVTMFLIATAILASGPPAMAALYDSDSDGYQVCGSPGAPLPPSCDCNDTVFAINPGAVEVCDLTDNNCNGFVDEGFATFTYYQDADTDGYGNPSVPYVTCLAPAPAGFVVNNTDCNDADFFIRPLAPERCNGIDDDCNSAIPANEIDSDGDQWVICGPWLGGPAILGGGDCNEGNPGIHPGVAETCQFPSLDQDCDGLSDQADAPGISFGVPGPNVDGDPWTSLCDCDDSLATGPGRYPGFVSAGGTSIASEDCDGLDNDCSGAPAAEEKDTDLDLRPACGPTNLHAGSPSWLNFKDCDDTNAVIYPGAAEICDGLDDDCNGLADDPADERDKDNDKYLLCAIPSPTTVLKPGILGGSDCNDSLLTGATQTPGKAEICDGIDNDCAGAPGIPLIETDNDGDGWVECLGLPGVPGKQSGDCDDANDRRYPGYVGDGSSSNPAEDCDGIDNDCTGPLGIDEVDADGDTRSVCGPFTAHTGSPVWSASGKDCNDANPAVYPGAPEICDGLDSDCTGGPFATELDPDLDKYLACTVAPGTTVLAGILGGDDCDESVANGAKRFPGKPEVCDGLDNNCDVAVPPGEVDTDGDKYVTCTGWAGVPAIQSGDCLEGNDQVSPAKTEICGNGVDDDCNAATLDTTAGVRYVSTTGVDLNNQCLLSSPVLACRTIQHAANVACPGETVFIGAGIHTHPAPPAEGFRGVLVTKSLTFEGASQATAIVAPGAEDDQDIVGLFSADYHHGFILRSGSVTFKTLTIDGGANPALNAGKRNFRGGIVTDETAPAAEYSGITVDGVLVKNVFRRGVNLNSTGLHGLNHVVKNSTFTSNLGDTTQAASISLLNVDATVTNNTVSASRLGVYVDAGSVATINNKNKLNTSQWGVFVGPTGTAAISNNDITANNIGVEIATGGVGTLSCNNISGNTTFGLATPPAGVVLAEKNWWGAFSGSNPAGTGDVRNNPGNSDADPWLHANDYCLDADGDTFGSWGSGPNGFVQCVGCDCNDANSTIHPNASEACDGVDADCDGIIDQLDAPGISMFVGGPNVDGDPFTSLCDCKDADAAIYPGAPELCDGKDNDCNGFFDAPPATCGDGNTCTGDQCVESLGAAVCKNVANGTCTVNGTISYYRDSTDAGSLDDGSAKGVPSVPLSIGGLTPATTLSTNPAGNYSLPGAGNPALLSVNKLYDSTTFQKGTCVFPISSLDASKIAQFAVGIIPPAGPTTLSQHQRYAADVSGNGLCPLGVCPPYPLGTPIITSFDAALVSQMAAHLISHFPVANLLGSDWLYDFRTATTVAPDPFVPYGENVALDTANPNATRNFAAILFGDVTGNWGEGCTFAAETSRGYTAEAPPEAAEVAVLPLASELAATTSSSASSPLLKGSVVRPGVPRLGATIYLASAPKALGDGEWQIILGIDNAEGIIALDAEFGYDPEIYTVKRVSQLGLANHMALTQNDRGGRLAVSLFSAAPMQGTGEFLSVIVQTNGRRVVSPLPVKAQANEGQIPLNWGTGLSGSGLVR